MRGIIARRPSEATGAPFSNSASAAAIWRLCSSRGSDGSCPGGSSLFDTQPVSNTAHCLQPYRIGRVALDLAAQSVDLHVDRPLAHLRVVAHQFVTRNRLSGALGEDRQDFLLALGQPQRLPATLQF